ncbi:hypothetical protein BDW66DRAFT_83160 [Aspergillus desertorum]
MRIESTFGGHRVSCILLRLSSYSSKKIDLRFLVSTTKDAAISEYVTERVELLKRGQSGMHTLNLIFFFRFSSNIQLRKRFLYPWVFGQVCLIFSSLSKNRFSIFQRRVQYHEWPMVWGVVYPASYYRLGHVYYVCDSASLVFLLQIRQKNTFLAEGFCRLSIPIHMCVRALHKLTAVSNHIFFSVPNTM